MNLLRGCAAVASAALLVACSRPPDVEELATRTAEKASSLLKGAAQTTQAADSHEGLGALAQGLTGLGAAISGGSGGSSSVPPVGDTAAFEQQVDAVAK